MNSRGLTIGKIATMSLMVLLIVVASALIEEKRAEKRAAANNASMVMQLLQYFVTDEGEGEAAVDGFGRNGSAFSSSFFDVDFIFKIKDYRAMEDDKLEEIDARVH